MSCLSWVLTITPGGVKWSGLGVHDCWFISRVSIKAFYCQTFCGSGILTIESGREFQSAIVRRKSCHNWLGFYVFYGYWRLFNCLCLCSHFICLFIHGVWLYVVSRPMWEFITEVKAVWNSLYISFAVFMDESLVTNSLLHLSRSSFRACMYVALYTVHAAD